MENTLLTLLKKISISFQPLVIGFFMDLIINLITSKQGGVPFPIFMLLSTFICCFNILKLVYKEYSKSLSFLLIPFILPVVGTLIIFFPYFLVFNIIHFYKKI